MRPAADPSPAPRASPDATLEDQKRAFLRVMSHELRTPLNSILGFSEILASELYGPLGAPQYKEYAEIVRDSGEKLLKMVNQLVEIARLQAQAVEFEPAPEPLQATLDEVLAGLAGDMTESAVTVKVDPRLPGVIADPRGLRAVLSGLIHNAIVFSPTGSQVRVSARKTAGEVEIVIENPGDPVDPADLARLKRPFEQGETALTRRSHGAGLGLSICTLTAKAMGGRLELSARPKGGLIARVSLPAA